MPKTLPPFPPDAPFAPIPNRKHWTRQECDFLEQNGLLTTRYELIDGEIMFKMPQNPPHQIAIMLIAALLRQWFAELQVLVQGCILLEGTEGSTNEPEPDVAVLAEPITLYRNHNPGPADILLLIEVSDTTLAYDLRNKAMLYARAGIAEYWVADIVGRRLVVHRQPDTQGYNQVIEYAETETLSLLARPDANVLVADFLPPQQA